MAPAIFLFCAVVIRVAVEALSDDFAWSGVSLDLAPEFTLWSAGIFFVGLCQPTRARVPERRGDRFVDMPQDEIVRRLAYQFLIVLSAWVVVHTICLRVDALPSDAATPLWAGPAALLLTSFAMTAAFLQLLRSSS